jgi:hypothetical protein
MLFFVAAIYLMLLLLEYTMFLNMLTRGDGFPAGLGDMQKDVPVHGDGDGDGDGLAVFSWGRVWASKIRWVSPLLPSWVT